MDHVCNLYVWFYVGLWVQKIAEEHNFVSNDIFRFMVEFGVYFCSQEFIEPIAILIVDQSVLENAAAFMIPQSDNIFDVLRQRKLIYLKEDDS